LSRHIRGERAEINIVVGFHWLLLWNNYLKKFLELAGNAACDNKKTKNIIRLLVIVAIET
jgi:hypothetical protein